MMLRATALLAAAAALAACSDDSSSDGIDAPVDAPDAIDAPDGPCGAGYQMTGEYIDWVATNTASDGIEFADFTVVGSNPPVTAATAPNGRIIICLPRTGVSTLSVVQDEAPPGGPYVDALLVADPAVLSPAGAIFSARGLKEAEQDLRYDELMDMMTYDSAAGHVLVVKRGTPTAIGIAGQDSFVSDGVDDITWSPGTTGTFTMFPNVPVLGGTATLTGAFTGPHTVPVQANTLTIVPVSN